RLGLFPEEAVEIDVAFDGVFALAEFAENSLVEAGDGAFDELVRVRQVEGGGAVHELAELGEDLGLVVLTGRRSVIRSRRRNALRTRAQGDDVANRFEEEAGVLVHGDAVFRWGGFGG